MRIAICQHITADYWGGGEKEMFDLSVGLVKFGHEVDVYALPYTLENKRKVRASRLFAEKGVRYHEGPIHVFRADVTYTIYHPLLWLSFITTSPMVASFHSLIWFNHREKRSGYGLIPKMASALNDRLLNGELLRYKAVHVHYDNIKRDIERLAPDHPRVFVIEHFVDTETFVERGPKADNFTALFIGRPVWQKGFDLFKRLAEELRGSGIKFQLVGGEANDGNIESLGMVFDANRLARIMSSAHVVVSPQRVETTPARSTLEAMSCGVPVIAMADLDPPIGDCKSLLKALDYPAMKSRLLAMKSDFDNGLYSSYGECARACVKEHYGYGGTIERYVEMFRQVIASR